MIQHKCENCIHEDLCSALNGRPEDGDATDCIYYLESNQKKTQKYIRTCEVCGETGVSEDSSVVNGKVRCYRCMAGYTPVCPRGYLDCVYDPAYIRFHYPEWYATLYGSLKPTEAILLKGECMEKMKKDPKERFHCYDDEDK